jgi:hypothetical protein
MAINTGQWQQLSEAVDGFSLPDFMEYWGARIEDIAAICDVTPRTVWRWLSHPKSLRGGYVKALVLADKIFKNSPNDAVIITDSRELLPFQSTQETIAPSAFERAVLASPRSPLPPGIFFYAARYNGAIVLCLTNLSPSPVFLEPIAWDFTKIE